MCRLRRLGNAHLAPPPPHPAPPAHPLAFTACESGAEGTTWGKLSPKAPRGFSRSAYGLGRPLGGSGWNWKSLGGGQGERQGGRGERLAGVGNDTQCGVA